MENTCAFSWKPGRFLLLAMGIALLIVLKTELAIIFLGILLGILLCLPVDFFSRWMPRIAALLLTLFLVAGIVGGVGYLGIQPLAEQAEQLKKRVPEAVRKTRNWVRRTTSQDPGQTPQKNKEALTESVLTETGKAAIGLGSLFGATVVALVLAAFFSYQPRSYVEGFKALIPKDARPDVDEVAKRLHRGIKRWLLGILATMFTMGMLTALGLLLIGIPEWPLLALLTFFGTFVPYIGAISSALPGLALALAESQEQFLLAILVYLGVHIVEGYVIHPIIMKKTVYIRPAFLLSLELAMVALLGFIGIVIATPLVVCGKLLVGYFYIEKCLHERSDET